MVVQFLDVRTVAPERLALWEGWLAPGKRQRLDRMPAAARLLSLCGDGLAREMLSRRLGCRPEEISFTYGPSGKPLVAGAHFSVSHSGDLVGCAVSGREVGLDLEQLRPVPPRLGQAMAAEEPETFFSRWTRREAAIKCRGGTLGQWRREEEAGLTFLRPAVPAGYVAWVCEKE